MTSTKKPNPMSNKNQLQTTTPTSFAIISQPESLSLMAAGFEAGVDTYQLPRIRVPSGGVTMWTVTDLDGERNVKELDCVIGATRSKLKVWWRNQDGTGMPPDCSSQDGITGIGNNRDDLSPEGQGQHDCSSCTWNKWGSDRKGGKGRDCKDFAEVYIFLPESRMPSLLNIPPSSLKELQTYAVRLISAGLSPTQVVTRLTLIKMQNASGQAYSQVQFQMLRRLEDAEREQAKVMSQELSKHLIASISQRMQPVSL